MSADEGRLIGLAQAAGDAADGRRRYPGLCCECGAKFEALDATAEFCSLPCRLAFNNRRRSRGAELYDLFMAHRFDRTEAAALGVLAVLNRAASLFREQDRREREGRKSWRPAAAVIARRPYLRARVLHQRKRPRT